jgi:hypothetical protein
LQIPDELAAETTRAVRALVDALLSPIDSLTARIADLEAENATLQKLPRNSSLPPSSAHRLVCL